MPAAEALADHLCALVAELTSHRQGPGPHWLMVSTIARELRRHGVTVTDDELQAAIAVAQVRCVLKVEGDPVHSISPWQQGWKLALSQFEI